jgi:iron(III) transport system permease protein
MAITTLPRRLTRRGPTRSRRPPVALLVVATVVGVLAIVPLAYLAIRALEGGSAALEPLARQRTLELVVSTLTLGLAVAIGAIALGLPLAWLTARTDLPLRRLWAIAAIAPLAIPSYLLAFSLVGAFSRRGWLASWLGPEGIDRLPDPYGLAGTTLVLVLATTPYVVIATRAALARLDPALDEAARSLGSGPWAAARTAVLPVIVPAVGAGALLAGLYAISDFGAVSILRYDTLATAIYSQYRLSFDRSAAAALALLLLSLALLLVWMEAHIRRRAAARSPHGRSRVGSVVRLGRWRWPALALCLGMALVSLGLPTLTVTAWLVGASRQALARADTIGALRDSLVLAIGAASLALLAAVPLAWLIVRYPGRWAGSTERLLYLVYAIPGISLALGVVSFTLHVLPALYQTLFALVVAVAMRFLIQSVGALRGPVLQISPRTLEAARSLGEPSLNVARTITLPLLRPGMVAGLALVFLSVLKELPLTLLLAPTGFGTLATTLWDAAREAVYSQAAVPALLLLVVSFLSLALLMRRGEVRA